MCFIHKDILIIGPCSREEIGYLKGEFLDRLEKLPLWNKTKYYCFASELLDVASGRSLDQDFLNRMSFSASIGSNRAGPILDRDPGTFRLEKYQITVATDGQVTWQWYGGMNKMLVGQCRIQSGVLFIGPEEQEKEEDIKGEFFKKLDTLPQWDRTRIWSRCLALRPCQVSQQEGRPPATSDNDAWTRQGDHVMNEKPAMECTQRLGSQIRSLFPSSFKSRNLSLPRLHLPLVFRLGKPSWHLFGKAKFRFIWIIPLVFGGLLLGLILSLHSVKDRLHRFHSSEEHHHK